MPEYLEKAVDKFTFRVAADRLYSSEGVWVSSMQSPDGTTRVRVGVSDFVQQHNGDVAFVSVKPVGTGLQAGDEFADVETMKTDIELYAPISGLVVEINKALDQKPEIVNEDPYGSGWLAVIEASAWEEDRAKLLDPSSYFSAMEIVIEQELKS